MKRFKKILVALVISFMSFIGLTACGKDGDEIIDAKILSGSLETTVIVGETVDTSKMRAQIRYKEADSKTVGASDLEIVQAPNTTEVGTTTMKLRYNGFEFTVKIKVVATEDHVNSISTFESQLLKDYNNKKIVKDNPTQEEFRDQFYVDNSPLYVGDDNRFDFRINAAGLDAIGNPVLNLKKVGTNISIARKVNNNFVELDLTEGSDDLKYFDNIDYSYTTIDFSDEAVDEVFQVIAEPVNKDEGSEAAALEIKAVLNVIDGYNVYNAADLSIYDNCNRDDVWTDKKEETGMTDKTTSAIILQDDIKVTRDDVPAAYFWDAKKEGTQAVYTARRDALKAAEETDKDLLDGTLKNIGGTGIYRREIASGEQFRIEGNYFMIDLSLFPKAVSEGSGVEESYSVISNKKNTSITSYFTTFYNTVKDATKITAPTSVDVQNVRFLGNGSLNNNLENAGSIILMKNNHVNLNAYNTIQHNYYIGYFLEQGGREGRDANHQYTGDFVIDTCKGYNSYQDLFYGYGAERVIIKNSEFIDAGGPAIIAAYTGKTDGSDKATANGSHFYIINSKIEAQVTGEETWFYNYNATSEVKKFSILEGLFAGQYAANGLPATGKTIYSPKSDAEAKRYNILGVVYNANSKSGSDSAYAEGSIRFFRTQAEYDEFVANGESTNSVYGVDLTKDYINHSEIYLEASGNGGYINQNVLQNWDTSYFGLFQTNAVAGIINNDSFLALRTAMKGYYNVEIPADFGAKTLDEQKEILIGYIDALVLASQASDATLAGGAAQMIQAIYAYGSKLDGYDNASIKKAVFNIDQLSILKEDMSGIDSAKLVTALKAEINAFENKSFAEGDCLNVYLGHLGLGAVIGLYTPSTQA